MTYSRICAAGELPPGESRRIETGPEPVALFNINGEFFATQDICTHGEWPLSEGYLEGDMIECPLHMARFCVRTGSVEHPPANIGLRTFPVKVEEGVVYVDLEAPRPPA